MICAPTIHMPGVMLGDNPRRGVVNQVPQFASVTKPPSVDSRSTIHWPASKLTMLSTIVSDGVPPNAAHALEVAVP